MVKNGSKQLDFENFHNLYFYSSRTSWELAFKCENEEKTYKLRIGKSTQNSVKHQKAQNLITGDP